MFSELSTSVRGLLSNSVPLIVFSPLQDSQNKHVRLSWTLKTREGQAWVWL